MASSAVKSSRARARRSGASAVDPHLNLEQIRAKAYEVYAMRMDQGAPGDAVSDWLQAERSLRAEAAARVAGAGHGEHRAPGERRRSSR